MKNNKNTLIRGHSLGCLMGFEPTTSTSTVWRSAIELQAPSFKREDYNISIICFQGFV